MPSFPGALDSLSNPAPTDTLTAVPHADQHATANDILEALEAKVGIAASTPTSGTVLTGTGVGTSAWQASTAERAAASTAPAAVGTAAVGAGTTDARADHVHATGAGIPSTQAFGDAAAVGSGPAAAMTDHKHAMPALSASTGNSNTALGQNALYSNTTGVQNTAAGYQALYSNTTGVNNTAAGYRALYSNTTGVNNTAAGYQALYSNTTGNNNTAAGYQAGRYIADGATANATSGTSLYLGVATKALADGDANEIVIGYNATGLGSNSVVLGSTSITLTRLRGKVGIGVDAPSALLHIAAGTAAASTAPLKLTAGTLQTTKELGAIEYSDDGTTGHLYAVVNVAGVATRVQIT